MTQAPATPAYQHVVVGMSILLGLTVTSLLKGAAQIYRNRSRVRPYWLHSAWVAFLLVFALFVWWTYWNYRSVTDWDFFRFVLYLSPTITYFFLVTLVLPEPSDAVSNLREYYYSQRAGFFGAFAAYGALAGATSVVVRGLSPLDPTHLFRLAMILLAVVAMRSTNERVHAGVLMIYASFTIVFVALFQLRLG